MFRKSKRWPNEKRNDRNLIPWAVVGLKNTTTHTKIKNVKQGVRGVECGKLRVEQNIFKLFYQAIGAVFLLFFLSKKKKTAVLSYI